MATDTTPRRDLAASTEPAAAEARLISTLLIVGAAVAVLGNALHPFLPADTMATELIDEAGSSAIWAPLHIMLALTGVLLVVGTVLLARHLRATAGASLAVVTATVAVLGGTIFTAQLGAVDGFVFPALARAAEQGVDVTETAIAMAALDRGLLSLVVLVFFGLGFLALGLTVRAADVFAGWIRWTAIGAGAAGVVIGTMMLVDVASTFTFVAFRVVALAITIVTLGIGVALRKGPAT